MAHMKADHDHRSVHNGQGLKCSEQTRLLVLPCPSARILDGTIMRTWGAIKHSY